MQYMTGWPLAVSCPISTHSRCVPCYYSPLVWNLNVSASYPHFWAFLEPRTVLRHYYSHWELRASLLGEFWRNFCYPDKSGRAVASTITSHLPPRRRTQHLQSQQQLFCNHEAISISIKAKMLRRAEQKTQKNLRFWWHCQVAQWTLEIA